MDSNPRRDDLWVYLTPRMLLLLWLGVVSGVPLALTASTLTAWLSENSVDIKTIGLFALVGIPYTFKFAFAPLMDGLSPPVLGRLFGRRRGWMIFWVSMLSLICVALSGISPAIYPLMVALFTLLLAFSSASFDISFDALRIEMLPAEEQGAGAAMAVLGYRIGMIVSSAGALYIAEYMSWSAAYMVMGAVFASGILPVFLCAIPSPQAPASEERVEVKKWLQIYFFEPFRNFMQHSGWWMILLFIVLFKLGDACLGFMTTPFLLESGYTKIQIADVVKLFGLLATIAGSLMGGWMVMRLGMVKSLWIGGILQAVANLPYAYLAMLGSTDTQALAITISIDNFCGGLSTTAFVAYISSLCNVRFSATQYALLNSLASIGRIFFTTTSGALAASLGWELFFVLTTLMGLPGLALLWMMRRLQKPVEEAR